ncbi:flagellar basal-body rod protein FlgG [Desulfonatronovibrio magnus]|uniref:flagellar basal-body rod protein FlgG n=1 Tax=Desulfonatronovibrio magnus TaxID=698827 RepID=UPI0005EB0995|nr:flagellar basal-body rod protein FlgG [Desulfonatronovibrio magnus]
MMRSLWTAASGMAAQQMNIDVTANNLANVNTTAFKKSRAEFEDLVYQNLKIAGTENLTGDRIPTGMQVGMGVRPLTVHKFFTQGDYQRTDNPLDLTIEGDGFFQVMANDELKYTRAGAFKLDQDGRIVTANGYPLQPEFNVPQDTVNIVVTEQGRLSCMDASGDELAGMDIPIFDFINPAGLKSTGRNLYVDTDASGPPVEGVPGENNFGTLAQGVLEMSNVELVEEMVNMIIGQRAYEINSKAIQTSDQMLQMANQLKR